MTSTTNSANALLLKPDTLSADELDKQLDIAVATGDKPTIHALAEERLHRDEFVSGISRRMGMMRQVIDLDIIREHETWRLGNYESFFAYLQERKEEYLRQGYDSEGDLLVVKGYSTVLAWSNILSHFNKRHGITLELLSYCTKGKLETISGVCNRWDAAHGGEMDEDLRVLLFDVTVGKDDILRLYAERKQQQGAGKPISDEGGYIEPEEPEEEHEASEEPPAAEEPEPVTANEELDVTLDTETGVLTAWARHGNGHLPVDIGFLHVRHDKARDLVLNLCETWRIRLK